MAIGERIRKATERQNAARARLHAEAQLLAEQETGQSSGQGMARGTSTQR